MEEIKKSVAAYFQDRLTTEAIEVIHCFLDSAHTQGQIDSLLERMRKDSEITKSKKIF